MSDLSIGVTVLLVTILILVVLLFKQQERIKDLVDSEVFVKDRITSANLTLDKRDKEISELQNLLSASRQKTKDNLVAQGTALEESKKILKESIADKTLLEGKDKTIIRLKETKDELLEILSEIKKDPIKGLYVPKNKSGDLPTLKLVPIGNNYQLQSWKGVPIDSDQVGYLIDLGHGIVTLKGNKEISESAFPSGETN